MGGDCLAQGLQLHTQATVDMGMAAAGGHLRGGGKVPGEGGPGGFK